MGKHLLNVGKLVNTHGLRGDVKVLPQTDFPEVRFAEGSRLLLIAPEGEETVPVEVEQAREQKGVYIVKLKGYADINKVERFKGWQLKSAEEVALEEDEYYHYEIMGCEVVTTDGQALGSVSEILQPGANDVWVVTRPGGKPLLLPVIADVVVKVEVAHKRITVQLLEGLM